MRRRRTGLHLGAHASQVRRMHQEAGDRGGRSRRPTEGMPARSGGGRGPVDLRAARSRDLLSPRSACGYEVHRREQRGGVSRQGWVRPQRGQLRECLRARGLRPAYRRGSPVIRSLRPTAARSRVASTRTRRCACPSAATESAAARSARDMPRARWTALPRAVTRASGRARTGPGNAARTPAAFPVARAAISTSPPASARDRVCTASWTRTAVPTSVIWRASGANDPAASRLRWRIPQAMRPAASAERPSQLTHSDVLRLAPRQRRDRHTYSLSRVAEGPALRSHSNRSFGTLVLNPTPRLEDPGGR
jgi:hypothetical protein